MRVVHLTSVHDALDVRIFHKECRALAAAGYDVVLVAPHDRDEIRDGVTIRAVPRPRGRLTRATRTAYRVWRAARAERGDLYHLHDPELLVVGVLLKLEGRRVVYDAHEHVPKDIRSKHYLPAPLRGVVAALADLLERAAAARLDAVVAVTPGIAARFARTRTAVVRNYPRLDEFAPPEAKPYAARPAAALYVGGLSAIRGAREMVRAIGKVDPALEAELWLAGRFDPERLALDLAGEPGWARTSRLGWRSRPQVSALLQSARLGLLVLHPAPNHLEALPLKLFEYMGAGLPVVASNFPAWRAIVGEAGLLVDPLDPDAIAEAIRWLLAHPDAAQQMGRRGRAAVEGGLHWDSEAATLRALYEQVLAPPSPRGAP